MFLTALLCLASVPCGATSSFVFGLQEVWVELHWVRHYGIQKGGKSPRSAHPLCLIENLDTLNSSEPHLQGMTGCWPQHFWEVLKKSSRVPVLLNFLGALEISGTTGKENKPGASFFFQLIYTGVIFSSLHLVWSSFSTTALYIRGKNKQT